MSFSFRQPTSYTTGLLLTALCLMGLLAYLPGLSGEFIFDDAANIVHNDQTHMEDLSLPSIKSVLLSSHSGPLRRPLSMITFGLNYYFTGLDPFYYKLTNLIIHLLNGIGLFFLTRLILQGYRRRAEHRLTDTHILVMALAVSAAWLLHPLNLTGVLYVVQRMTSLSALFVIWGLVCYVAGRQRVNDGRPGTALILTGLLVFTPLAVLSKENGALLPVFMLVIEYIIFAFETPQPRQRRFLYGLFGLSVAVPAVIVAAYTLINPHWLLGGYQIREFNLTERLLTECRVLWFYLMMILAPTASQLGLFHDDFPISHGLLEPLSTLPAVIGLAALLAVALWSRRRAPLVALGLLWFFAGHSLESTALPLELAYEHRNYLPEYGILLIVIYYLIHPFALTQILRARQVFAAAFIVLLGIGTTVRASDWGNPALLAVIEAAHHPDSPRADYGVGVVYSTLASAAKTAQDRDKYYNMARTHFEKSGRLGGNNLDGLFAGIMLNTTFKRPVDEQTVNTLVARLRDTPFANNNTSQLDALAKCEEHSKCDVPLGDIGRMFEAALDNPTLKGRARAMVLSTAGEYLINKVGNYPDALDMLHKAVEIEPDSLMNRLNLSKALVAGHRFEKAHKQLEVLKTMDTWGIYTKMIAEQEKLMAQMQKPRQTRKESPSKQNTAGAQPDFPADKKGA